MVYSGSVFPTSPEVNKIQVDGMKATVISAAKHHGNFQKYEAGSAEYVAELSTAIAQSVQFSMDTLRDQMGTGNRTRL